MHVIQKFELEISWSIKCVFTLWNVCIDRHKENGIYFYGNMKVGRRATFSSRKLTFEQ